MPGDKSISHRAAIFAALARGRTQISNFSSAGDCAATLACLRNLGVDVEHEGSSVWIEGVGPQGLRAPSQPLDCGNSGTTLRLLAGVLAGQYFSSILTGDESLRSRPMRRIIEPLERMGARIFSENNRAPLRMEGRGRLNAITYEMPVDSAQVKSAILLAGLNAGGLTEVIETKGATRDHTERMLRWFRIPTSSRTIQANDATLEAISVKGRTQFNAADGTVPGDISSASFFIAAAALLPGSKLTLTQIGLNPTRTRVISVLRSLGVDIRLDSVKNGGRGLPEDFFEPFGNVSVSGGAGLAPAKPGQSNVLSGTLTAQLIDELPLLAIIGTQVLGGLEIRDAAELRVKESDRIQAAVENLRLMGAQVEEQSDGLIISSRRTSLRGAKINAHGDHRIAMAFTVAALIAEGESEIMGAECVRVSFPEFFALLESIVER